MNWVNTKGTLKYLRGWSSNDGTLWNKSLSLICMSIFWVYCHSWFIMDQILVTKWGFELRILTYNVVT